jgi:hypothetical protein
VIRLVGSLTSILSSLHEDIHSTLVSAREPLDGPAQSQQPAEA